MHDGMQYDPIQGQGQGYEPLQFGNSAIFIGYLPPIYNGGWQMTMDSSIRAQYLKQLSGRILFFLPSFCVTRLRSWQ